MASTRNKNTSINYSLEQRQSTRPAEWRLYENGANGYAYDTRLPGNGLNPGQFPCSTLSKNSVNIESFLFGINSTNLVNPAEPLRPELLCLETANIFQTQPIIMPVPLVVSKEQRPFPLP
jgi:hypothetical protein